MMRSKSKILLIGIVVLGMGLFGVSQAYATWTPGTNELGPTKDTYVSVDGALSDPSANYGGASSIAVGDGFDGDCVGAIYFNLNSIPADILTLQFQSDITVYGSATRTVKVFILLNATWDELVVTGLNNPFNATAIYLADPSEANCTTITLTQSMTALSFSIYAWKDAVNVTLLFTAPEGYSWFTMSSRENPYLGSYSHPPRLVYTRPQTGNDNGIGGFPVAWLFIAGACSVLFARQRLQKS
jgi:hypothetical protein